MILLIEVKHNLLNQDNYDLFIDEVKKNRKAFFQSVFGSDCDMIFYGAYTRYFITAEDTARVPIKIQRVYDKKTHQTHALLPFLLVPHSMIPLPYQVNIIKASEEDLPELSVLYNLDPKTLLHVRKIFHAGWSFLFKLLNDSLTILSATAHHHTGKQFMQSRGHALLYSPT